MDDPVKIIPQGSLALKKIASVCVDDAISGVGQDSSLQRSLGQICARVRARLHV